MGIDVCLFQFLSFSSGWWLSYTVIYVLWQHLPYYIGILFAFFPPLVHCSFFKDILFIFVLPIFGPVSQFMPINVGWLVKVHSVLCFCYRALFSTLPAREGTLHWLHIWYPVNILQSCSRLWTSWNAAGVMLISHMTVYSRWELWLFFDCSPLEGFSDY